MNTRDHCLSYTWIMLEMYESNHAWNYQAWNVNEAKKSTFLWPRQSGKDLYSIIRSVSIVGIKFLFFDIYCSSYGTSHLSPYFWARAMIFSVAVKNILFALANLTLRKMLVLKKSEGLYSYTFFHKCSI